MEFVALLDDVLFCGMAEIIARVAGPFALYLLEAKNRLSYRAAQEYFGPPPKDTDRPRRLLFANIKATEVFWSGHTFQTPGKCFLSPVEGPAGISSGLRGGIGRDTCFVGVSGMQEGGADLLLAATFLYMCDANRGTYGRKAPMYLHHIGRRTVTLGEFITLAHGHGVRQDVDSHLRNYTPIGNTWQSRVAYEEVQFYPGGPHDNSVHFDMVLEGRIACNRFLAWLSAIVGSPAEFFEDAGANDPVGMVSVPWNSQGETLAVMARPQHWQVM